MRAPRVWVLVAAAVAVVVGGVVLAGGGDDDATPVGPEVVLVGDSVTYSSAGAINERFAPVTPQFVARPGYTTADLLPLVRKALAASDTPAARRQRVGVLVGYNDIRLRRLDTSALPALVRETSRFRCAVWLTLPARPGGEVSTGDFVPSKLVDRWNQRLADEIRRYPNVHLDRRWAEAVTAAPASELLRADGVHPVAAGQDALALAYDDALRDACG